MNNPMKQDNEPALPLWLVLLCFLVALLGANYLRGTMPGKPDVAVLTAVAFGYVCGRPFRWAGKGTAR